jgi:hypothetical protein
MQTSSLAYQQPESASKTVLAHALPTWFIALTLGLIATIPRIFTLNDFFTVDESFHWVWRVMHFMHALEKERWASTNLTGHPGVTTLWLGSLGRTIAFQVGLYGPEWYKGGVAYLALLRLPLALVNTLAVVGCYLVLRYLLRPATAVLAGLLWALSPFLIAHSRLLHMDALLTSCMTLSVLLLLAATYAPSSPTNFPHQDAPSVSPHRHWLALVGSGVCAGLALLTKAPSLLLLPVAGLLLLWFSPPRTFWQRAGWLVTRYAAWLLCALLIFVVGWPAMWVEPGAAIGHIVEEIIGNGAQPHPSGNFFLGQPVADPGWLFYPAVVLWRSTPFTLAGLLLVPLAVRWRTDDRRALLALGSVVLLFGLALSMLPKKFDRYLLPTWPLLEVLAAAGLMALLDKRFMLFSKLHPKLNLHKWAFAPLLLIVAVPLVALNLWYHPHYLAYFNPLLGGGRVAQHIMLVGWGEGMEQVGAWLRTRPDLQRSPVISWDPRTLEPLVPVRVVEINATNVQQPASYAVLYSRGIQREQSSAPYTAIQQTPPLYTLRMYGIDYAQVHQPVRPFDTPLDVVFGEGLHLRGYSQRREGNTLIITPSWNVQRDQPGGLFCFVHVLNSRGERVAQIDAPIDEGLFATWQRGQQFGGPLPIGLPANLPPGTYRVGMGVYNPTDVNRFPITQGAAMPEHVDGPSVVLLTTFEQP